MMRPLVLHALVWGLALSVVLSALLLGILRANPEIMLNDYPPDIRAAWGPTFLYFATMFGVFNVFDWLVLDCGLIFFQPPFATLPGTAGLPGYRDHRFHFRGFLVGIPVVLLGSAIAASVATIVL